MRLWSIILLVFMLISSKTFADHQQGRCGLTIVQQSGNGFHPFSNSSFFIVQPLSFSFITQPPSFITPWTSATPQAFLCLKLATGNISFLWCEPLKANIIIIGQPYWCRPSWLIDPFSSSQLWRSPIFQPEILTFQLKNRSADEIAKLLNEAKVIPDGRFTGIGNLLIVSAHSLATTGVQQVRLRELISALDRDSGKLGGQPQPSSLSLQVDFFRVHAGECSRQEENPTDKLKLLRLLGYPCVHHIGVVNWKLTEQSKLTLQGENVEAVLQGKLDKALVQIALDGKLVDKAIKQTGSFPLNNHNPVVLIAQTQDGKDALIALLSRMEAN